jgi:hypothetical protein
MAGFEPARCRFDPYSPIMNNNKYLKNAKQNYLIAEAVRRNYWAKRIDGTVGWTPCDRSDPDAHPDLNRVLIEDHKE